MLAFFSISSGLWENFQQLWLENNGFSISEVSTILSVGTFVSVLGILLVGQGLKMSQLSRFMALIITVRLASFIGLVFLDGSTNLFLIDLCTITSVLTGYLMFVSIYPLLTMVAKSNRMYSRRKLVEYLFQDVGILVGGILVGQHLLGAALSYNGCLLVAIGFLCVALGIMLTIRVKATEKEPAKTGSIVKYIAKSRMQRFYMLYAFLAATSFATALGLKMLVLTNYMQFTASTATNYLLIVGLASDVIGIWALRHFTPKNDYVTMTLKFGIRLVAYAIAIIATDPFISLLAMTWSIMISTAYEDVSDGYYINTVDNGRQFRYGTIKQVVTCLGEAVGMLLCGWMYNYGLSYMFGLSAIIMAVQIVVAYYLIYLRKSRRRVRHSASRLRYDERIVSAETEE